MIKKFNDMHNDENLNEKLSAKIRNSLSPFWNIVSMIEIYNEKKDERIWEYIMKEMKNIEKHKDRLLLLINMIDDKKED
jgi:hypothetical protein